MRIGYGACCAYIMLYILCEHEYSHDLSHVIYLPYVVYQHVSHSVNAELVFFLFRYNLAVSGFLIVRYVLIHFSATLTCHEAANVIVTDDVTFGSHDVSLTPHFLRFPPANSPLGFAILFVFDKLSMNPSPFHT